jgi:MoaA/NifB/PqqE/SkfB family radical SAM enzyme
MVDAAHDAVPDAELALPSKVTFIATELCNMRCRHCYSWKVRDRRTLSSEVILGAVAELADWVGPYKLFLAGGEPTIRRDLPDIVRTASSGGCMVSLATNGYLLNEARAEALVTAGLDHVDLALDSLNPEIHDAFRGRRGTHQRALRALELLDDYRRIHETSLSINTAAVVSAYNYAELCAMAHWVRATGYGNLLLQPIVPPFWSNHDRGWLMRSDLWPRDPEAVHRAVDGLIRIKEAGGAIDNSVEQLRGMKDYFSWAPPPEDEVIHDEAFADDRELLDDASEEPPRLEVIPSERDADLDLDEERWEALEDDPAGVRAERIDRCHIGWKVLNINHVGDVRLCHDMPPIGNLNRSSLKELWTSPRAMQMRERIAHCHEGCYLLNCNFCD